MSHINKISVLIIKVKKMHYFSNLFDTVLYMFQTGPPSIIKSISTLYTRNRYLSWVSASAVTLKQF
jgi:hypothetical protein